jgi:hypothetical protein
LAAGDDETTVFSTLPSARILLPNGYPYKGTYTIEVIPGVTKPTAGYIVKYVNGSLTVNPPPTPEYFRMIVPNFEGVTTNPGAGEHQIKYGDDFSISFTAKDGYSLHGMKLFANNMEEAITVSDDGKTATATIETVLADILLRVELQEDMPGAVGNHPQEGVFNTPLQAATTTGGITVSGLHVGTMLYIYNMTGQLVYSQRVDVETRLIASLPTGAYIVVNDNRRVKAAL